MKILIVTGGSSSERKISLISAGEVKRALEANKHTTDLFDYKKGDRELKKIAVNYDLVFPVLHGEEGEGGDLQKLLSKLNKPYVGGDPKGLKIGWYKIPFKQYCDKEKIPTAKWQKVKTIKDIAHFGLPCVVKSSNGGSSKEVAILRDLKDLKSKLFLNLFKLNQPLFAERFLPGVEITVGILGKETLPIVEIIPPKGGWFDYKNKYSGESREIIDPPNLKPEVKKQAQEIALKIHQALKLGPFSRIDFIVVNEIPYVLEVNIIPGMTPESLFPKAAKSAGYNFPKLIQKLVTLSL